MKSLNIKVNYVSISDVYKSSKITQEYEHCIHFFVKKVATLWISLNYYRGFPIVNNCPRLLKS